MNISLTFTTDKLRMKDSVAPKYVRVFLQAVTGVNMFYHKNTQEFRFLYRPLWPKTTGKRKDFQAATPPSPHRDAAPTIHDVQCRHHQIPT